MLQCYLGGGKAEEPAPPLGCRWLRGATGRSVCGGFAADGAAELFSLLAAG